jgi:Trk-type K+ transport system membrane component
VRFSLYTKITTITFGILVIAGFIFILLAEYSSALAGMPWSQKVVVALFQSITTRSGGFSTIDMNILSSSTLLFLCLMMFIGASPSSCGGGIRTTTFAVLLLSLKAYLQGRIDVKVFQRELYQEDIIKALLVFFLAVMLVVVSVIALSVVENFSSTEILFEVCSAFGTTGLSMGITSQLSSAGKAIIIANMLIGRIGLITLLLLFRARRPEDSFHYVKEHINIG